MQTHVFTRYRHYFATGVAKDRGDEHDNTNEDDNPGFKFRKQLVRLSRTVVTEGAIGWDLAQSGKLLVPGLRISITLKRAPDAFCLMSDTPDKKYYIEIESIELDVTRYRLREDLVTSIYSTWSERKFISYQFRRFCLTGPFEVPANTTHIDVGAGRGQRPLFCLVFFVSSQACRGDYKKNPLKFHHMDVDNCQGLFESQQAPILPYAPHFSSSDTDKRSDVTRIYCDAMRVLGILGSNGGCGIDSFDFSHGFTVFPFLFAENMVASTHFSAQPESGFTRLVLRLAKSQNEAYNMYCLSVFQGSAQVSNDLNVSLDHVLNVFG